MALRVHLYLRAKMVNFEIFLNSLVFAQTSRIVSKIYPIKKKNEGFKKFYTNKISYKLN